MRSPLPDQTLSICFSQAEQSTPINLSNTGMKLAATLNGQVKAEVEDEDEDDGPTITISTDSNSDLAQKYGDLFEGQPQSLRLVLCTAGRSTTT